MAQVYRAVDTRLERTVAIKVLRDDGARHPDRSERFAREAHVVSRLNHANICTLHDIGRADGIDYLVIEYLDGVTLAERLKQGPLPVALAREFAIQIAEALDAAHRKGIVHRDLKPSNVMVTKAGVKVLDFGIARMMAPEPGADAATATSSSSVTVEGTLLGTLQYMSPEQVEGRTADPRSDLFAFGAVLYEMVTGQPPFHGESRSRLAAAILDSEPAAVSRIQPQVPAALERIIARCLAKDPEERWQSAADLATSLRWIAAEGPTSTNATSAPALRRSNAACWVAVAAIAVAVVMGAVAWRRPLPEVPTVRLDVVTPPTTDPTSLALSPDGTALVFVAGAGADAQLWLRRLDQTTARPLEGTSGATLPFWSPDSRSVAFFAAGKLKRVSAAGGMPQVVADAPNGQGGTWSRDDVILFGGAYKGLRRVAATGGATAAVTTLKAGEADHRFPEFLPDGRHFLFFVQSSPELQGTYFGSLDAPMPRRLMSTDHQANYVAPGYLLTVQAGVLLATRFDADSGALLGPPIPVAQDLGSDEQANHSAFSASTTGLLAHRSIGLIRRQLVWFDRRGVRGGSLGSSGDLYNPQLAPDGRHVAVVRNDQGNQDIWLVDTSTGAESRFTFDAGIDGAAAWSPDGSRVVFGSNRNGAFDLFEKPASGARDEKPLHASSRNKAPADWSANGVLLFDSQDTTKGSGRWELWALPLNGDKEPFPFLQEKFDVGGGQFSPDGRWVAYLSNESGHSEIFVRSFPGRGGQRQVSVGGGNHPRWRHDGKELFYIAPDRRLMAVAIRSTPTGQALDVAVPVPLFTTAIDDSGRAKPQYVVDRSGQRFLMSVPADASASPITIVQNWMAGLKK